jgi:hypothetical protein
MRQLHLVESETQGGHVVVATVDGLERFELEIDDALRTAVGDGTADDPPSDSSGTAAPPATESRISPREIQVRIRGGADPAEVAEACGSGLDWVLRFAAPVLDERARVAGEARRAKARRRSVDAIDEGQVVVFGEAVDERFAGYGIEPGEVRWDAYRREDGQWIIAARWVGGQSEHDAEWIFHLSGRMVTPVDDAAADLLSDRPLRPLLAPPEPSPAVTVAPPLIPGVVAFPVMSDTDTGPLPAPGDTFDDHGTGDADPQNPLDLNPSEAVDEDEPLLPMDVPDEPEVTTKIPKVSAFGRRRGESDEERAARATVPKWDDILLGVRRKRE